MMNWIMSWIKAIFATICILLLIFIGGGLFVSFVYVFVTYGHIVFPILVFTVWYGWFKPKKMKKPDAPDESLLILHMTDKYNTANVAFSDLVGCLEEKGFSITEYCAIRKISFNETEKDSKKYHSIFKKLEKLMEEEK